VRAAQHRQTNAGKEKYNARRGRNLHNKVGRAAPAHQSAAAAANAQRAALGALHQHQNHHTDANHQVDDKNDIFHRRENSEARAAHLGRGRSGLNSRGEDEFPAPPFTSSATPDGRPESP
jgi:hypothetical protein